MKDNKALILRFSNTLKFFRENSDNAHTILDIGTNNSLSELMRKDGFNVINTDGQDLDLEPHSVINYSQVQLITAFEIIEHLVSPLPLLKNLPADRLIATVPLRLWFAKAYRSDNDTWDRHYHEFEDWQFDWLLEKSGWTILKRKKWVSPSNKFGFRSILRRFTPRYYGVYAERQG